MNKRGILKIKLLALAILLSLTTKGYPNSSNYFTKESSSTHKNECQLFSGNEILSNNFRAYTLSKTSYWNNSSTIWDPGDAHKYVYINGVLTSKISLNYDQNDTNSITNYTYDNYNRLISDITYNYVSGALIPHYRTTFTYSNNYTTIHKLLEKFDTFSQTWEPNSRVTTVMNSRGVIIKYVSQNYFSGVWEYAYSYSRNINYLNNTNKIIEYTDSTFNSNTNTFDDVKSRQIRSYNSHGQVINILYFDDNGSGLKLDVNDSIKYKNGIPESIISYKYDPLINSYYKYSKIENLVWLNFNPTIDIAENRIIGELTSAWNANNWKQTQRRTATLLDNYGSHESITEYLDANNEWIYYYKYIQLYDVNKNAIEFSRDRFNTQTKLWERYSGDKTLYAYDNNNNIIEEIYERFNVNLNAFEKTLRYEYSDFITITLGANTIKNTLETKLYPNPSADGKVSVNVKMEAASELSIKITDLKGSVVYTDKKELSQGLNTIELSGLKQGLYLVEMNTHYGVSRTKLLVN